MRDIFDKAAEYVGWKVPDRKEKGPPAEPAPLPEKFYSHDAFGELKVSIAWDADMNGYAVTAFHVGAPLDLLPGDKIFVGDTMGAAVAAYREALEIAMRHGKDELWKWAEIEDRMRARSDKFRNGRKEELGIPDEGYSESATVNGIRLDVGWDGQLRRYAVSFPGARYRDLGSQLNRVSVGIGKTSAEAKRFFDRAAEAARKCADDYSAYEAALRLKKEIAAK